MTVNSSPQHSSTPIRTILRLQLKVSCPFLGRDDFGSGRKGQVIPARLHHVCEALILNRHDAPAIRQRLIHAFEDIFGEADLERFLTFYSIITAMADKPISQTITAIGDHIQIGHQVAATQSTVNILAAGDAEEKRIGTALQTLVESVLSDSVFTDTQRKEALEALKLIGEQAKLPSGERQPSSIIKAVWASIPSILSTASSTIAAWNNFAPQVGALFGF